MKIKYYFILNLVFFTICFSNSYAKNIRKFDDSKSVSNYFSGVLSSNNNGYASSYNFLKKLKGLESSHYKYSQIYLNSLINLNKIPEAYRFSKDLEKKNLSNFESELIIFVYHLKNKNRNKFLEYAYKINSAKYLNPIQKLISETIMNWANINNLSFSDSIQMLNKIDNRFDNIKKIQKAFLNCFYDTDQTNESFNTLISNTNVDFSRYYFFYSNYLLSKNNIQQANLIIEDALTTNPRNLILNQLRSDLQKSKNSALADKFNCKNISHSLAEILYVVSNALSSQSIYTASNYYLNLAKFLNPDFTSYKALHAENLLSNNNYEQAKEILESIKSKGAAYNWFSVKRIAYILNKNDKEKEAITFVQNNYKKIDDPDIYTTFDYAEFLKNNKKFNESIKYYTIALQKINNKHVLYPDITDGRGIAFERIGKWKDAENDLLKSLKARPDQAYVLNYLAYSWIEKGVKIKKSLELLEKANTLKKDDGYITDSLGWALFQLKEYEKAKKYLQKAVKLMPSDPVVNDHYGDSLWMTGKKIQARYYWNYVIQLEETETDLKKNIEKKNIIWID